MENNKMTYIDSVEAWLTSFWTDSVNSLATESSAYAERNGIPRSDAINHAYNAGLINMGAVPANA
jgi:hypothetical protein